MIDVIYPDKKKCIGKGSYGQVFLSNHPNYVCKIFDSFRDGIHEYTCIYTLSQKSTNNCIMSYHSLVYREEDEQLYIEHKSGDLKSLHDQEDQFTDPDEDEDKIIINLSRYDYNLNVFNRRLKHRVAKWPLKIILFELFKSYDNLYQNFLIHGDIKMDNILVKKDKGFLNMYNYKVALCDFSLTFLHLETHLDGEFTINDLNYIQTVNYRSPELILGDTQFNYKIDIWSIGIIILKLLKDLNFFKGKDTNQQINFYCRFFGKKTVAEYCSKYGLNVNLPSINYQSQKGKIISTLETDVSLIDLLDKILILDPNERIDLNSIFKHHYFIDSDLIYPFKERNTKSFLDNFFTQHPINPNTLKKNKLNFNRTETFLNVYEFLLKNDLSVKLLFQTVYLFDYLRGEKIINNTKLSFITVLKILGYQRLYDMDLLPLIYDCNNALIDKKQRDEFESYYYGLLAKLKNKINVFCYLDYLDLTEIPNNYSTRKRELIWILLILFIADIQHYQYIDKLSIMITLVTIDKQLTTKPKLYNVDIAKECLRTYNQTDKKICNKFLASEKQIY